MSEKGVRTLERFAVLDSFRGLCACIVAFSHFNANSIFYGSKLLDRGDIYVDFFFVLSGFVIFANYGERLRSGYGTGKFIWLRFWRLYPLHFAVLMAFILSDVAQFFVHIKGAALYAPFAAPGEGPDAILANLLMIHSLHTLNSLSFNGPSWSISVEFYTYMLFALVLFYGGKFYRPILIALAMISAITVFHLRGDLYAKTDFGIFRCIYGFVCGVMAYEFYYWASEKLVNIDRRVFNFIEVAASAFIVLYIALWSFSAISMAAPLLFAVFVVIFAFEGGAVSAFLKGKVFMLLGILSYSIYMNHSFISGKFFAFPLRLAENYFGQKFSIKVGGAQLIGSNLWYGTVAELGYLFLVIACSYISYRLIETPLRNWSKRTLKEIRVGSKRATAYIVAD